MKSIGLVARTDNPEALGMAKRLGEIVVAEKLKLQWEDETARALRIKPGKLADLDLIIVLGGDGTVLRTVRKLRSQIPILAFNAGTVGFISEGRLHEASVIVHRALRGEGRVEKCTRIICEFNGKKLRPALNDVILLSSDISKVIHLEAKRGKSRLFRGLADGAMISTAVGSTAYSMAVGGPIIDPGVDAFVFNILYPVRLAVRPVVLPVTAQVSLHVMDPSREGLLIIDGQREGVVRYGDKIVLRRASEPAQFLRLRDSFYKRVHRRMSLEV